MSDADESDGQEVLARRRVVLTLSVVGRRHESGTLSNQKLSTMSDGLAV